MNCEFTRIIEDARKNLTAAERKQAERIYNENCCTLLSQSPQEVIFTVSSPGAPAEEDDVECSLIIEENGKTIKPRINGKAGTWDRYTYACLMRYEEDLKGPAPKNGTDKKYTRKGMMRRVLEERREKAEKASYRIKWADNIYGDHILTNEKGLKYTVFLRDFEHETGYSNSADAANNKLGTTKHIMYAFAALKKDKGLYDKLDKTFPFIEVYCDPLNNYNISWYYPAGLPPAEQELIAKFFKTKTFIENSKLKPVLKFIEQAESFDTIRIRPEVREKVERYYEDLMLEDLREKAAPNFSLIKAELFPYQAEGITFALFRRAAIIADEMGLGKTIQAIGTAVLKKQVFGFTKTLVVCPATLKSQWKKEIEKFSNEKALILSGPPAEREQQYLLPDYFFFIVNYETVLRDSQAINQADFDVLILDEAQKIKNYETKTASAVKRLRAKHALVITGTPIENRLIDIYSIINAIDPHYLGPLWEFSYQHCLFDLQKPNKINGYYDLQDLNIRLAGILIRRERQTVLSQLPDVQQKDVPLDLSPRQQEYHASYMKGIGQIIRKKYLTPYDLRKLTQLLGSARMVCDSTYLIDESTNDSPKLLELEDILLEKLDIKNKNRKVIVFSEWIKMHRLIGNMLRKRDVGFTELNGTVPVKQRGALIKYFEQNQDCKVFLSTEAGGAGLNLQMADTLINFELPWNPAKKNQRIGRIDRLGQKSPKLLIYNLISRNSIEQQIAAGLLVKQSLFEGVLSENSDINYVDFSTKGRSQFIRQLEALIQSQEDADRKAALAPEPPAAKTQTAQDAQAEQLEQVLTSGMSFLSGLFKMTTGADLDLHNQKLEVDRQTGEVRLTFKIGQQSRD
ncbi:MAG: DEAD/DEAH box helicase [Treponema sp.]|jgi:SNF2 family DNA or RNA helicase|nr:DEAD/DEAH box helicase [Treponema sp.]